jgi:hypothetical protein
MESSPRIQSAIIRLVSKIPDFIWAPLTAGILVLILTAGSVIFKQLWLFPSLSPTAFVQAYEPKKVQGRLYNSIVGHFCGVASGYLFVVAFGLSALPSIGETRFIDSSHAWASVLAVFVTLFLQIPLKSFEAAGAATSLLITFGFFKLHWHDFVNLVVGVLIISIAGEVFRRVRAASRS